MRMKKILPSKSIGPHHGKSVSHPQQVASKERRIKKMKVKVNEKWWWKKRIGKRRVGERRLLFK
jgi:hypothetical protein